METIFSYDTAKHTLVMTAYMMLIMLDIWGVTYIIKSLVMWVWKKAKGLFKKKPAETIEEKDN